MGKKRKWKTTAIPTSLYNEVLKVLEKHGYTSVTDFVKDAVRRRIDSLQPKEAGS